MVKCKWNEKNLEGIANNEDDEDTAGRHTTTIAHVCLSASELNSTLMIGDTFFTPAFLDYYKFATLIDTAVE